MTQRKVLAWIISLPIIYRAGDQTIGLVLLYCSVWGDSANILPHLQYENFRLRTSRALHYSGGGCEGLSFLPYPCFESSKKDTGAPLLSITIEEGVSQILNPIVVGR